MLQPKARTSKPWVLGIGTLRYKVASNLSFAASVMARNYLGSVGRGTRGIRHLEQKDFKCLIEDAQGSSIPAVPGPPQSKTHFIVQINPGSNRACPPALLT